MIIIIIVLLVRFQFLHSLFPLHREISEDSNEGITVIFMFLLFLSYLLNFYFYHIFWTELGDRLFLRIQ